VITAVNKVMQTVMYCLLAMMHCSHHATVNQNVWLQC